MENGAIGTKLEGETVGTALELQDLGRHWGMFNSSGSEYRPTAYNYRFWLEGWVHACEPDT